MKKPLDTAEISQRLKDFTHWKFNDGALEKDFTFQDFRTAFRFMTMVASAAEQMNHHPDWTNVYNKVKVRLNTHDAKGVTELDFSLAQKMNQIFLEIT